MKNSQSALILAGKVEENRQVTKKTIQLVGYFARFPLKKMEHHCCGYRRRQKARHKATQLLLPLLKQAKASGMWADYLLMDSCFAFPKVLVELHELLPVICRAKDLPHVRSNFKGQEVRLGRLYRLVGKRPGGAKYLASVIVESRGLALKAVFVRHRECKKQWMTLLSTDTELAETEIVRLYGRRRAGF